MAWTTPKTWVANEGLTATLFNTHIRDNLLALKSPPFSRTFLGLGSNLTTTSTTYVDISATYVTATITTTGGDVFVTFTGNFKHSTGGQIYLDLSVDGTLQAGAPGASEGIVAKTVTSAAPGEPLGFTWWVVGLSAGSHLFKVAWKVNSGTATFLCDGVVGESLRGLFSVRELS